MGFFQVSNSGYLVYDNYILPFPPKWKVPELSSPCSVPVNQSHNSGFLLDHCIAITFYPPLRINVPTINCMLGHCIRIQCVCP
ncbi:hypothetical protein XELAEV_18038367mg [Xenopus laevis]|uniref:Uncharacterized protein n=1 Tax=Xenopus laevis TaxID=8355 RepID=A0A974H6V3_XENLA|nr:hypothetical protein XELAEV_18038367mg [Xenopus laevis]